MPTRGARMPASGATIIGASVHGVVMHGRLERGVALHDLQELDQDEDGPEHPEAEAEADDVRDREAAVAEQPERQQRRRRCATPRAGRRRAARRRRSSEPSTSTLSQPAGLPRTMPKTMPSTPEAGEQQADDVGAHLRAERVRQGEQDRAGRAMMPTGTLSQKIACQFQPSTTAPPISGPTATPRPAMPPQMPIASGRSAWLDGAGEQGQRERHDARRRRRPGWRGRR